MLTKTVEAMKNLMKERKAQLVTEMWKGQLDYYYGNTNVVDSNQIVTGKRKKPRRKLEKGKLEA